MEEIGTIGAVLRYTLTYFYTKFTCLPSAVTENCQLEDRKRHVSDFVLVKRSVIGPFIGHLEGSSVKVNQ